MRVAITHLVHWLVPDGPYHGTVALKFVLFSYPQATYSNVGTGRHVSKT